MFGKVIKTLLLNIIQNILHEVFLWRYESSPNNIELPLLIEYNYKRFFISGGIKISLFDFYKTTEESSNGSKNIYSRATFGYDIKRIFPTFRLSYIIKELNKDNLKIYFGIDNAQIHSYDMQMGLEFQFH